jgi:hypothetical protein
VWQLGEAILGTTRDDGVGTYAHDPKVVGAFPSADAAIERIGDLLGWDLPRRWSMGPVHASTLKSTQ